MNLNQLAQSLRLPEIGTYSELSAEYYDPVNHPTCADFRSASRELLHDLIEGSVIQVDGSACEVGAGKSLVAEVLLRLEREIQNFLITDISFEMLWHSRNFSDYGASLLVADAYNLPLRDETMDMIFAILGDPYNVAKYWEESARVLRPHGMMLFLVPSHVWATKFRASDSNEGAEVARFETGSGKELFVPSYIRPAAEQMALARKFGFERVDYRKVPKKRLQRAKSPKLCLLEPEDAVVESYIFLKQS